MIINMHINTTLFFFSCLIFPRDIPMPLVSSGVEHGNLRELALARMKDMGTEVKSQEWQTKSIPRDDLMPLY